MGLENIFSNIFGGGGGGIPGLQGGVALEGGAIPAEILSAGGSIFSNPTVLSSGILAGTSLLTNLFGSSASDKLSEATLAEQKRQFDAKLALEQQQLAQALEIAKLRGGGGGGDGGAGIAARTNLKIAKSNAEQNAAKMKSEALQLPLQARAAQQNAAQTTGIQSGNFFNALIGNLQRPALGVN